MAEYIDREALIEWLKRIKIKDLSDGLGLCRVIFEDDFKKAIKEMPKRIVADAVQMRHGRRDEEVKDYPPYLDYPKPYKAMTNADRIRAMSDEEMAKMLTVGGGAFTCLECREIEDGKCSMQCVERCLEWLQQQAEGG